ASAKWVATAASTALPPRRRTSAPTSLATRSVVDTRPWVERVGEMLRAGIPHPGGKSAGPAGRATSTAATGALRTCGEQPMTSGTASADASRRKRRRGGIRGIVHLFAVCWVRYLSTIVRGRDRIQQIGRDAQRRASRDTAHGAAESVDGGDRSPVAPGDRRRHQRGGPEGRAGGPAGEGERRACARVRGGRLPPRRPADLCRRGNLGAAGGAG